MDCHCARLPVERNCSVYTLFRYCWQRRIGWRLGCSHASGFCAGGRDAVVAANQPIALINWHWAMFDHKLLDLGIGGRRPVTCEASLKVLLGVAEEEATI